MVPPLFNIYIIIMRLYKYTHAFQASIKDISLRLCALLAFTHERPNLF